MLAVQSILRYEYLQDNFSPPTKSISWKIYFNDSTTTILVLVFSQSDRNMLKCNRIMYELYISLCWNEGALAITLVGKI